jgi:hypothetical protein
VRGQVTEATLKTELCTYLEKRFPRSVVIRHEDLIKSRAGVPDISFTWNKSTVWIEGKLARPRIVTKYKIQTFTMMRLAYTSHAIYVIWAEQRGERKTFVCKPRVVHEGQWNFDNPQLAYAYDFDYKIVGDIIEELYL